MSPFLQPGDVCADHEILALLAVGEQAEVYAALSPEGEPRALKIVAADQGLAATVHARFAHEGVTLTRIVHPCVLRFYGSGIYRDRVWLLLEVAPGVTLRKRLHDAGGPIRPDHLLFWLAQACDGLAEAHRVGVTHRHVTPEHILVADGDLVKVIDFILARFRGQGIQTSNQHKTGRALYASPEYALGVPAGPAMDVYAMGIILYEGLTGVHPMGPGEHPLTEIVLWHLHGQPPPLLTIAPWVPLDVAALVHQAMDKDPARRPTMRALTDGLRDALASMRAPQRREAANLALPNREEAHAPTIPMPAQGAAAPAIAVVSRAPASTTPMAAMPAPPATVRSGPTMEPPATIRSGEVPERAAPVPVSSALWPAAPAELRSTEAPAESMLRPRPR